MSLHDDNPLNPQNQDPHAQPTSDISAESSTEPVDASLSGTPISYADVIPTESQDSKLPEDLRISWSWVHLLVFGVFVFSSLLTLQLIAILYGSAVRHLSQTQLKQFFESDPRIIIGMNVIWFAMILFFLYITLAVLRNLPFWQSLGWRKLTSNTGEGKGRPWMYFLSGCGLSIFVVAASSRVKEADHMPIQELFKSRTGAFALMAMAVLIAPLVEETVFRGYLYPTVVRIVSAVVSFVAAKSALASRLSVLTSFTIMAAVFRLFHEWRLALTCGVISLLILVGIILVVIYLVGKDSARITRASIVSSIVLTGTLFGLTHGAQLGWTWGLVSLLTLVGVIFTFARAWTGTVLASFLLHLGYNSMIAFTSIIATKGFTHMTPGH